ncbi:MAG TPA: TMEM175 family protein [Gemmatimonadales bacterium]|nr:TMEM175 family protein [Gemmatimonadales bacterium]
MGTHRLEAFSDGVLAIIITIMVLELKVPHGEDARALAPLIPVILSYVLSFVYVGIYWTNHHHLMHACHRVSGSMLWANLHLLFWLSLVPFTTGWMGENHFASVPEAAYGFVLLMAAIAYYVLQERIIAAQGEGSILRKAVGRDWKGRVSPFVYIAAMALGFVSRWLALALYVLMALIWIVPDRRIERVVGEKA